MEWRDDFSLHPMAEIFFCQLLALAAYHLSLQVLVFIGQVLWMMHMVRVLHGVRHGYSILIGKIIILHLLFVVMDPQFAQCIQQNDFVMKNKPPQRRISAEVFLYQSLSIKVSPYSS